MIQSVDPFNSQHDKDIVIAFNTHYQNYDPFFYQSTINNNKVLVEDINGKADPNLEYQCKPTELEVVDILSNQDMLLKSILNSGKMAGEENEVFFYHGDHLGSANWITNASAEPIQYIHYAPYGELLVNQTPHKNYYNERYKFTGKERDTESGYDFFGARYYWSSAGHFMSPDPHLDARLGISSYAYCSWDPVNKIDPDGRDEEQRQAAIDLANKYVEMNPNKSSELYKLGAKKGKPGEPIDCSGLGSNCAKAGGEKDPNYGPHSSGVRNIVDNTQKIEDMNDIEAGYFVMFNNNSHMGVVTDVTRDESGNVVDFQFIHSATSTGPIKNGFIESRYWRNRICGFYKWDTRPDTYAGPELPQITAWGSKPNVLNLIRTFNVKPISINVNPYIRK